MMPELYPVGLKRDNNKNEIIIEWNDGRSDHISFRQLRDHCCCAACRAKDLSSGMVVDHEKPGADPFRILTAAEARPLEVLAMTPVGNYAYHIEFSDGHNTGIFTFERMRQLGDRPQDGKP